MVATKILCHDAPNGRLMMRSPRHLYRTKFLLTSRWLLLQHTAVALRNLPSQKINTMFTTTECPRICGENLPGGKILFRITFKIHTFCGPEPLLSYQRHPTSCIFSFRISPPHKKLILSFLYNDYFFYDVSALH